LSGQDFYDTRLRIPVDLRPALEKAAKRRYQSKAAFIRQVIAEALEREAEQPVLQKKVVP
jgi:predicted transcriptional regulator